MIPFLIYAAIFVVAFFIVKAIAQRRAISDYGSLKTVTFGDESAVKPSRPASIISILTIFLLWGMFTGSSLLPGFLHAPGPFQGTGTFEYTVQAGNERRMPGRCDDGDRRPDERRHARELRAALLDQVLAGHPALQVGEIAVGGQHRLAGDHRLVDRARA